jgi:hypothetical protein
VHFGRDAIALTLNIGVGATTGSRRNPAYLSHLIRTFPHPSSARRMSVNLEEVGIWIQTNNWLLLQDSTTVCDDSLDDASTKFEETSIKAGRLK